MAVSERDFKDYFDALDKMEAKCDRLTRERDDMIGAMKVRIEQGDANADKWQRRAMGAQRERDEARRALEEIEAIARQYNIGSGPGWAMRNVARAALRAISTGEG